MSFPDNCTPTTGSIVPDAPMHMNNSCVRLYIVGHIVHEACEICENVTFLAFLAFAFFFSSSSRVFSQIL